MSGEIQGPFRTFTDYINYFGLDDKITKVNYKDFEGKIVVTMPNISAVNICRIKEQEKSLYQGAKSLYNPED